MEIPRIVVLGGGESGTGAAVLAHTKGFEVFLSDKGKIAEKYREVLSHHGVITSYSIHYTKLYDVASRNEHPVETTAQLCNLLRPLARPHTENKFLAQVFQSYNFV